MARVGFQVCPISFLTPSVGSVQRSEPSELGENQNKAEEKAVLAPGRAPPRLARSTGHNLPM